MKSISVLFLYLVSHHFLPLGGHDLTLAEASGILGEPCIQLEKTSTAENGGHQFRTSFVAESSDKVLLSYMFESYRDADTANDKYDEFYNENASMLGFNKLTDLGDEAFYHSDDKNFSLIIVRKDNEMIRIKVNKITTKYSQKALKKTIVDLLQRI
jgi:hypothetical protein